MEVADVLVVNRFVVRLDEGADFAERAGLALAALAARPGYVRGELGRAYDDPEHWSLVTEWESVGAYRRALGAYDVKVHATPLLAQSLDEPSAYEVLARTDGSATVVTTTSDRSVDADRPLRSRP
jgi:heme oxygenase (mycobilin-producing)